MKYALHANTIHDVHDDHYDHYAHHDHHARDDHDAREYRDDLAGLVHVHFLHHFPQRRDANSHLGIRTHYIRILSFLIAAHSESMR